MPELKWEYGYPVALCTMFGYVATCTGDSPAALECLAELWRFMLLKASSLTQQSFDSRFDPAVRHQVKVRHCRFFFKPERDRA
jgi:hypothetical protein